MKDARINPVLGIQVAESLPVTVLVPLLPPTAIHEIWTAILPPVNCTLGVKPPKFIDTEVNGFAELDQEKSFVPNAPVVL